MLRSTLGRIAALVFLPSLALTNGHAAEQVQFRVKNPLGLARREEVVSVPWPALVAAIPGIEANRIAVRTTGQREPLRVQKLDLNGDGTLEELIFRASFAPGEIRTFSVVRAVAPEDASCAEPEVFGRLVPERMDDFTWENDRIAFRMYGRAVEQQLVSSGVDVWCKRTRALVIDRWYRQNDYHRDHGEGLDSYTVGPTRGAGGTAIVRAGKWYVSRNFTQSRVLAAGPIRFVFELTYPAWDVGGVRVSESKRITLDAGQNLSRFECTFTCDSNVTDLPIAIGLAERTGQMIVRPEQGWMRGWAPADLKTAGMIGVGLVIDPLVVAEMKVAEKHAFVVVQAKPGQPVTFYSGAAWDQSGDFPSTQAWDDYLAAFAQRMRLPLQVSIVKE